MGVTEPDPVEAQRAVLLAQYGTQLASGAVKPVVLPYSLLGGFVLPVLYLSVPHTTPSRRWLFNARWLVFAVSLACNLDLIFSSSASNPVIAYFAGLAGGWGILWSATLLCFTRPQFDFEMISKRRVSLSALTPSSTNATAYGSAVDDNSAATARRRKEVTAPVAQASPPIDNTMYDTETLYTLTHGQEYYWVSFPADADYVTRLRWAINLAISFRGAGWSYATLAIPRPPAPKTPHSNERVAMELLPWASRSGIVRAASREELLRQRCVLFIGYYLMLDWLSVAVLKAGDPWFLRGVDVSSPDLSKLHAALPFRWQRSFLLALPPAGFGPRIVRYWFVLLSIWSAINTLFAASDLMMILFVPLILGANNSHPVKRSRAENGRVDQRVHTKRQEDEQADDDVEETPSLFAAVGEPWQYPSQYGELLPAVLQRGLAGFWGGYWHQSFRFGFTTPWLTAAEALMPAAGSSQSHKSIWTKKLRNAVIMLGVMSTSGLFHGAGSWSGLGDTWPLGPALFFTLSGVGILFQDLLATLLVPLLPKSQQSARSATDLALSKVVRQLCNLAFALLWSQMFASLLLDDVARAGIWVFEPVPISVVTAAGRLMGLKGGRWDKSVVKWWPVVVNGVTFPGWWTGKWLFDSGLAI